LQAVTRLISNYAVSCIKKKIRNAVSVLLDFGRNVMDPGVYPKGILLQEKSADSSIPFALASYYLLFEKAVFFAIM